MNANNRYTNMARNCYFARPLAERLASYKECRRVKSWLNPINYLFVVFLM